MVEGLTHNKGEEEGFFEKDLKRKGFIKEKKERQGPKGKIAFLPPLVNENRGGAMGHRRPWARGPGGMAAAGDRGERAGRRRDLIPLLNFRGGGPQGGARRPWPWWAGGGHGQRGQGRPEHMETNSWILLCKLLDYV